jgi:transcriptional regulator with XRE-family HTH domain
MGKESFEKPNKQNILERLRELLEALGMSSTEFAKSVGMSKSRFSMVLNHDGPSEKTKHRIYVVHHVNPNWLEFGEGPMFAKEKEEEKDGQTQESEGLTREQMARIISQLSDALAEANSRNRFLEEKLGKYENDNKKTCAE